MGPRDGLQKQAPVPSGDRRRLSAALGATGVRRIEAVAFVSPKAIPPMAGAAEVMAGITRRPGVAYRALVPNVKGAEFALAARVDEIEVVVSASETHNRKNVNRSVDESIDAAGELTKLAHDATTQVEATVSTAFGCPYEGDVPGPGVTAVAAQRRAGGAGRRSGGDTTRRGTQGAGRGAGAGPVELRQGRTPRAYGSGRLQAWLSRERIRAINHII